MKWGDFVRQDKNTQGVKHPKEKQQIKTLNSDVYFKKYFFKKDIDKH